MRGYASILLLILVAVALPIIIWNLSWLLRPSWPSAAKYSSYECGIVTTGEAREKFSVRYYLIAVLFVVFDVETIFLFPWAVMYHRLKLFGLVEMLVFLVILVVGYVYAWRRGALSWA